MNSLMYWQLGSVILPFNFANHYQKKKVKEASYYIFPRSQSKSKFAISKMRKKIPRSAILLFGCWMIWEETNQTTFFFQVQH